MASQKERQPETITGVMDIHTKSMITAGIIRMRTTTDTTTGITVIIRATTAMNADITGITLTNRIIDGITAMGISKNTITGAPGITGIIIDTL